MQAVRSRELADWLNRQHVFPVSPNTLLMTLQTIALVHKWYGVASRFEKSRLELGKAQKSFDHCQSQFEKRGQEADKAQTALDTASRHPEDLPWTGQRPERAGTTGTGLAEAGSRAATDRQGQRVGAGALTCPAGAPAPFFRFIV